MYDARPTFDDVDAALLAKRIDARAKLQGPLVGDFVFMPGEEHPRRFTHDWIHDIQTTVGKAHPCDGDASFYFCAGGGAVFSGSLDRAILKKDLMDTGETREGGFWFFHHDHSGANRGVQCKAPCRVYRYNPN